MNIFLSHSSVDKRLARLLADDLEKARVGVWLDQRQIRVGENFATRIEDGLNDADFVIVLVTRAAVASDWVSREWRHKLLDEARLRRISVIPVRGEPCEMPDFLAQRSHADISGGSYPRGFRHLLTILRHYGDGADIAMPEHEPPAGGASGETLPIVTPIALEVSRDLIPLFDPDGAAGPRATAILAPQMRASLETDFGFPFPGVAIRGNDTDMPPGTALILIDEVPELTVHIRPDAIVVDASPEQVATMGVAGVPHQDGISGRPQTLITPGDRRSVQEAGFVTRDATEYVFHTLERLLRTMPGAFLDLDVTRRLADFVEASFPDLVSRTVPAVASWFELTDVLRRLVNEEVSISDLAGILHALTQAGPGPHDTVTLTERSRQALRSNITARFARGQAGLRAIFLSADVEASISAGIERTTAGAYLHLAPDIAESLLVAIRDTVSALGERAEGVPLLVESADVRPFVRRLVSLEFPTLHVLSRADVVPDTPFEPLGLIRLDRTTPEAHGTAKPSA